MPPAGIIRFKSAVHGINFAVFGPSSLSFRTVFWLLMNILFVDDLPDTCEVFKLAFRLDGHNTRIAHNGVDAVDAVREELFDAIIMDVEMPKLNGWDATSQIRTLPNGETVPIIMFTAYGTQADRNRATQAGADDLMQKPVLPSELLSRIKELRKAL